MVIPAGHRAIDLDLHARLIDASEDVGAVDLHPQVVAPGSQLDQIEDHLGVDAQIQFDLVADGHVLDRLGHEEAQPVAAVLAEEPHGAVGQRRGAELRVLVVGQEVHPHQLGRHIRQDDSDTGS